ncbi:MAG TPA: 3-dehydroquinate synthase, partial [Gemmataceae bacterium]|nr:3-dehydroquinate synthase [Gemmataceae bacterium]
HARQRLAAKLANGIIMSVIRVQLGVRSYDIVVTTNDVTAIGPFVRQRVTAKKAYVIADENVTAHAASVTRSLEAAGFEVRRQSIRPGEQQKCLATAASLYDEFAEANVDRKTPIIAVGGGVIGDLAGFVAATYNRGLPLVMAPTTLLAMVDSSVGGKVGINHPKAKNLIGAFHQPAGVWIDTSFLDTLPDREFRSGLAEVVKYGVSLDAELFAYLELNADKILQREPEALRHIITRSCQLKAGIVEQDEREETGLRAVLNYGHTFGHAFENVGGYGAWLHGEAVAAGMMCAAQLAERRGLWTAEVVSRQKRLLERLGLPVRPLDWDIDALMASMRRDKKALAGQMRFVLPHRLGAAGLVDEVPQAEVRQILQEALAGGQ